MPCSGAAGGSFFVGCVRERDELDFGRGDEARERDDDRVPEAMRPRYPGDATLTGATRAVERRSTPTLEVYTAVVRNTRNRHRRGNAIKVEKNLVD